jgi:hypothetical protein|tara:strand:- start:1192 stop:1356 length:165 start_codon:yes stop_codon:yes gene_type:complete
MPWSGGYAAHHGGERVMLGIERAEAEASLYSEGIKKAIVSLVIVKDEARRWLRN